MGGEYCVGTVPWRLIHLPFSPNDSPTQTLRPSNISTHEGSDPAAFCLLYVLFPDFIQADFKADICHTNICSTFSYLDHDKSS
jgi:hypothetical protein